MFPWMREQISEAWSSRKNSRSAKKHSLNGSSKDSADTQMSSAELESFLINVISLEGGVMNVAVTSEFTIEKVKSIATEHFYGHKKAKQATQFRLVHGTLLKPLLDKRKLGEEEISESDELLLVEIRPVVEKEHISEEALKGPSEEEIKKATKELPVRSPAKPAINVDCPADFQDEIRKILITLVKASAKILMYSPDAIKFYEIIKEKLETQLNPPNDPKAVKYLVEMGFSEKKVLKALRLRKMNTSEALEWLLEHIDEPEDEEEIQLPSIEEILNEEPGPSSSESGKLKKGPNLVHLVNLFLENFRQHHRLDFRPNPALVLSLEQMGFQKKEIIEALKNTGNNQANACSWLLGERSRSIQNLYEGMDPEGPIYNAIMTNPQIQLSLTNPNMLLAYLSMLETPMSTSVWMKDPQVSPVLNQIFKTYHAEKHAIHVNRYDSN